MAEARIFSVLETFRRALALSPGERAGFLETACAGDPELRREVEQLLELDENLRAQESGADWLAREVEVARVAALPRVTTLPERIGSFRIVGELGRGGMGVVYRAEQEHPVRSVALKVLHPIHAIAGSGDRFQREADLLGRLQHPGIAQVYEAGVDGELAWFAMELVEGVSPSEYARTRGLGTPERLELLVQAAVALEHVHQRGIVHRDLKPSNLLVTQEGRLKVLDFGIARSIGDDVSAASLITSVGLVLGTVAYMSPEQGRGEPDVDTRADVYSLGAIAYELLSGELPLPMRGRPVHECLAMLETEEPLLLGKRDERLAGNVEAIVARALEKGRDRRYSGMSALIADLGNHLAGEPILARPPTTGEQVRRFVRRHKILVGWTAAFFISLSIGLFATLLEVRRSRADARNWAVTADFLGGLFAQVRPGVVEANLSARELLDRGVARIRTELQGAPVVRVRLLEVLASSYLFLGLNEAAEPLIREAVALRREGAEGLDPRVASALRLLAGQRWVEGEAEEAAALYAEALDHCEFAPRTDPDFLQGLRIDLALALADSEPDRAEEVLARAETADVRPVHRTRILSVRAHIAFARGDEEQGRRLLEQACEGGRSPGQVNWTGLCGDLNSLGVHLESVGRMEDALPLYDEALDVAERYFGRESRSAARILHNRGSALLRLDRLDEGERDTLEAYAIRCRVTPEGHPTRALSLHQIGSFHYRRGERDAALEAYLEARSVLLAAGDGFRLEAARSGFEAARIRQSMALHDDAAELFAHALGVFREELEPDDPILASLLAAYGANELDRAQPARAEPLLREALEARRRLYPTGDWRLSSTAGLIGRCLALQGELGEARPMLVAAHEALVAALAADHPRVRISFDHLAELELLEAAQQADAR